jgi:hypothetical protein
MLGGNQAEHQTMLRGDGPAYIHDVDALVKSRWLAPRATSFNLLINQSLLKQEVDSKIGIAYDTRPKL